MSEVECARLRLTLCGLDDPRRRLYRVPPLRCHPADEHNHRGDREQAFPERQAGWPDARILRRIPEEWPTHRLVALYLAPESSWGNQQVEDVRHAIADRRMIAGAARTGPAMSWTEIAGMIE